MYGQQHRSKYCFIDTETTGLYPGKHSIIQLSGYIDIDEKTVDTFNHFAYPFEGAVVDPGALKANNISLEDLEDKEPVDNVIRAFRNRISGFVDRYDKKDKFIFIAYNSKFDEDFIRSHFNRIGDKYYGSYFFAPSLCVMQMSLQYLLDKRHDLSNFKLVTVASEILGRDVSKECLHDASVDIAITRELFYALRRKQKGE